MVTRIDFSVKKRKPQPLPFTIGGERDVRREKRDEDGNVVLELTDGSDESTPVVVIEREGDSHEYLFTPPKQAIMFGPMLDSSTSNDELGIGIVRATFDWLSAGLSTEDSDRILARVKDPSDDLDFDDLQKLVGSLQEAVAGRPPTSSGDSGRPAAR